MSDPSSLLRSATRRAKSDVANKLVSMFLHELSRLMSRDWPIRVESEEYAQIVREHFGNLCPYCSRDLASAQCVIEHPDGMNRERAGLHLPGNVLVACRKCNSEKRRDDSATTSAIAPTGWESFLSHDGSRCRQGCQTCAYWASVWPDATVRSSSLGRNLEKLRAFRSRFPEFEQTVAPLAGVLPSLLRKLYSDCQDFAQSEIRTLLERFDAERKGVLPIIGASGKRSRSSL